MQNKNAPETEALNQSASIITQGGTKNKESFVLYSSYKEVIGVLSDESACILFKAILEYQSTGEEIKMPIEVKVAFGFIKNQLRIDNDKYNEKLEKCRENGAKGGRPRKYNEKPNGYLENQTLILKTEQKLNENENVKVNEKVNVNKKKYISISEAKFINLTQEEFDHLEEKHGAQRLLKGISIFEDWLAKGGKNAKQYIGKAHYVHFKSDSWVWEKTDALLKKNRATSTNAISAEYGRY